MAGRKGIKSELKKMLRAVPEGGISNAKLRNKLGWSESTFWRRRDELISAGQLVVKRGRGGTVHPIDAKAAKDAGRESDYYSPVLEAVASGWYEEYEDYYVQVTASAGQKATGGRWTRPDVTLVGVSFGEVLPPFAYLDVHTFEIKRVQDADVTAVHEALRHRTCATHSWVVIAVPTPRHGRNQDFVTRLGRVGDEATRHGIGLAVWSPKGRPRWSERIRPIRSEPDPRLLDSFIVSQIHNQGIDMIDGWFSSARERGEDRSGSG